MSSDYAIRVKNLSKCYEIYEKPHHRLLQMIGRGRRQYYREFWALRDVSLEVKKGETVGIIGKNGSGKSTLLKMICGTLHPTSGTIETQGRIAAILELGAGFNPEFTGRENVYMKGSILGLNSSEIDRRFKEISDFAEIGDFMEQPVRTYSSGMMVRLAFAVSVNVDPEILVVDEALSVGDERFQRKCFSRIEAIREAGATILFVSHSGPTIVQLCSRAILLDDGERMATGIPKTIYGYYQRLLYAPEEKRELIRQQIFERELQIDQEALPKDAEIVSDFEESSHQDDIGKHAIQESYDPNLKPSSTIEYESRGALIHSPKILTLDGKPVNNLIRGKRYRCCYSVDFAEDCHKVRFGMLIKTVAGVELGGAATAPTTRQGLERVINGTRYEISFDFRCSLNTGTYFINAGVSGEIDGMEVTLHRQMDFAMFKVQPESGRLSTAIVDFDCNPEIKQLLSTTQNS